jgi:hypothetical protein
VTVTTQTAQAVTAPDFCPDLTITRSAPLLGTAPRLSIVMPWHPARAARWWAEHECSCGETRPESLALAEVILHDATPVRQMVCHECASAVLRRAERLHEVTGWVLVVHAGR